MKSRHWRIYHFSGARAIWERFRPPDDPINAPKPATGIPWLIAAYVAVFGLATTRYENRGDVIETRANFILMQMATPNWRRALIDVGQIQATRCPEKPDLFWPPSVIRSLIWSDSIHVDTVDQLTGIVAARRDSLDGVNLSETRLRGGQFMLAAYFVGKLPLSSVQSCQ